MVDRMPISIFKAKEQPLLLPNKVKPLDPAKVIIRGSSVYRWRPKLTVNLNVSDKISKDIECALTDSFDDISFCIDEISEDTSVIEDHLVKVFQENRQECQDSLELALKEYDQFIFLCEYSD